MDERARLAAITSVASDVSPKEVLVLPDSEDESYELIPSRRRSASSGSSKQKKHKGGIYDLEDLVARSMRKRRITLTLDFFQPASAFLTLLIANRPGSPTPYVQSSHCARKKPEDHTSTFPANVLCIRRARLRRQEAEKDVLCIRRTRLRRQEAEKDVLVYGRAPFLLQHLMCGATSRLKLPFVKFGPFYALMLYFLLVTIAALARFHLQPPQ
ncbi:uncharacterized protein MYCFIDRAFT_76542 [Pseudocercospora fijiensis CIRAD86]|uniref:Uncharacterized protein n=1 Tax=Pseudocercospora fijiensis (strain CIRAD86) TaxID=383855 RepID=N1Q8H1_PSEFD|nr:uncharacterized protein MYCFIDRAFT_76542 [Pseudocercospora fijiensis CIRAD86]EME89185.1 hypothetical protein MYCFIDRAFT_76542 [Pseudocercospora fijiensis CIRAD86]